MPEAWTGQWTAQIDGGILFDALTSSVFAYSSELYRLVGIDWDRFMICVYMSTGELLVSAM